MQYGYSPIYTVSAKLLKESCLSFPELVPEFPNPNRKELSKIQIKQQCIFRAKLVRSLILLKPGNNYSAEKRNCSFKDIGSYVPVAINSS